jgi:hypothetical protein
LAGVALCHDVAVALTFARARRQLGLAGLSAMLAAHVGLTFEIVLTGHAASMRKRGIGSERRRLFRRRAASLGDLKARGAGPT